MVKTRQTPTAGSPTSTNTNMKKSKKLSLLTGRSESTVDTSTLVSKIQYVFDEFFKAVQYPDLAASFENMEKIWYLN